MCYLVAQDQVSRVLEQLDFREKGGYTRTIVQVHRVDNPATHVDALLYTANPSNPNFHLVEPSEAAAIIASAVGPSGSNMDYFERLAEWVESVGEDDPHISTLRGLISPSGLVPAS